MRVRASVIGMSRMHMPLWTGSVMKERNVVSHSKNF
jgi:hypothetical protein